MSVTSRELKEIGFPEGKAFGMALRSGVVTSKAAIRILAHPEKWAEKETAAGAVARQLKVELARKNMHLREKALPFAVFGEHLIDYAAKDQMREAMRLPVARKGALMPDAHLGYGLPIGGVLALENAVSPWAVGVDIGCRMHLSVFHDSVGLSLEPGMIEELVEFLNEETRFGKGCTFERARQHPILHDARWQDFPVAKRMRDTAAVQLGTSGGGNHFVEFGWYLDLEGLRVPCLAILSHSGSRGFGARTADHYSKIAEKECKSLRSKLAYLDLDSEAGDEYWRAMEFCGDYARANHEVIHRALAGRLGLIPDLVIQNHHNFAWREKHDGEELIVHRKGATPSAAGELGIIPGTMTSRTYIVEGRGSEASLDSSSHGAGRTMSRKAAKEMLDPEDWAITLESSRVTLIGSSLDEAPGAYKDIEEVIKSQREIVQTAGWFRPAVVRMA